ncbi:DUF5777 family beta-barrel protein [Pontibacter chinhatensis]|uniref:DUF5777 domain-containing protein n=1 Tax=Pontibacter chinhatensis TaxID=1436961 RepID=A0A1I2ZFT0_9BACT|nr:DUF5777 family beta-barrel protein [Pontibacter chinhatensis]SFH36584.1 hypothetical protein SAMN05421739_11358 [Pontibacter chinhatensis]
MRKRYVLIILCCLALHTAKAQDDLLQLAESSDSAATGLVTGTFKATRLANGHSVETNGAGVLLFLISHRFGTLNSGAYEFFGLDQATIRLGLEYGLTDRLNVGIGRSSLEKTYDGFLKYKLLQQRQGMGMPVTLTLFTSAAIRTLDWPQESGGNFDSKHRFSYTYQALLARKFTERLSLQLSPTLVHRNLVPTRHDDTDVYALGAGGRFKITKHTSFNAEYYYLLSSHTREDFRNALSLGFDIETGGHVFQLIFTNAQGMVEKFFVPQNTGYWSDGDIYFGFNISRVFDLKGKEKW